MWRTRMLLCEGDDMLRALIIFIGLIVVIPAASNGEWGTVGITVAIVLVLLWMGHAERVDVKAWSNRQRYWAYGEKPDWAEKRRGK